MTDEEKRIRSREATRKYRANKPKPTEEEKVIIDQNRRIYYANNKERILAKRKTPEAKAVTKQWVLSNREHLNALMRGYRKNKPMTETQKSHSKEWKKEWLQIPKNKKQHNLVNRKNFLKRVSWFYAYKKTLVCIRCGYNDWRGLDFHHRDPSTKSFDISKASRSHNAKTKEQVMAEIVKCDVICACCHKIEHSSHQYPQKFDIRLEYYVNTNTV